MCRYIYYGKTRRVKLAEDADSQFCELLAALEPQGVNAENFHDTAISEIADEISEILIDPFLTAVENTFADLCAEEEEEMEEEEPASPEKFNG